MASEELTEDWRKLMSAIFKGDESTVVALLGNCTDGNRVNFVNKCTKVKEHSALHLAAHKGYSKIAQLLVKAGADIYAKDSIGQTPLMTACLFGNLTVVETLFDSLTVDAVKTAYINLSDSSGCNAVFLAAEENHYDLVKLLVTLGGILTSDKRSMKTHLMRDILKGNKQRIEKLLDCFFDEDSKATYVNIADKSGLSAIAYAAQKYCHQIVDLLIKSGSDLAPVKLGEIDNNPLSCAIFLARNESVKVLLDSFTDERCDARKEYINMKSGDYGNSMLGRAAGFGRYEIVDILVQYGADLTSVDDEDWTPLMWASYAGHEEVVETLLSYYKDEMEKAKYVNHQDMDGCTAMSLAATGGFADIVEFLIRSGGDVKTKDIKLYTPLALAADTGKLEVVQVILDSISDESEKREYIDARRNTTDHTPMSLAALRGHKDIVKLFIECGADPTIYSSEIWTPLMLACNVGNKSIVQMVLSFFPDETSKTAHVNLLYKEKERPAVYYAVWKGNYDNVLLLLKSGANIIMYDVYQWSPLMRASYDGNLRIVKLLLDWLPDDKRVRYDYINKGNINSKTALEMAQRNGHHAIVDLLIKSGAANNISRPYRYNQTTMNRYRT